MKKFYLNVIILLCVVSCVTRSYAQEPEVAQPEEGAEKTTELSELVVVSDRAWFEDGKAVFVPAKSEKNLSRDMNGLIERMHTGVLNIHNGAITGPNGQPVSIFINGVPVDDIDISTFWARNVYRVEYMESSNDPQFLGRHNILNFVMKDYVAGGLTKLDADQTFPNDGRYSAASKLVWGKMTYNAIFDGGYSRDHFSGDEKIESYDDVWYSGTHYDNISKTERSDATNRNDRIYGGFSARYRTDKLLIYHKIGLQWDRNPESSVLGTMFYTPDIINGDTYKSISGSRTISPGISAEYAWFPQEKWTFNFKWNYNHSHNRNYYSYTEANLSPIISDFKEESNRFSADFTAVYNLKQNLAFAFELSELRSYYNDKYTGNTNSNQWQGDGQTKFLFQFWYQPHPKVAISLIPQISFNDRHINHAIHETEWLPGCNISVGYNINRKNNIYFDAWYSQSSAPSSTRNDLILRQTELRWVEGNPVLKSNYFYWLTLRYYIIPTNWLNSGFLLDFNIDKNNPALSYYSGGTTYDGVVGKYDNGRNNSFCGFQWDLGITLFKNHLKFGNSLTYRYNSVSNGYSFHHVRTRPYISWDFGNCSIVANYGSPEKFFRDAGCQTIKTHHNYGLDFTYGNGNIIVGVELNNIFNKKQYTDHWFASGPYSYTGRSWENGRNVRLRLTYTFDYGKKVDKSIQIGTEKLKSSSYMLGE